MGLTAQADLDGSGQNEARYQTWVCVWWGAWWVAGDGAGRT